MKHPHLHNQRQRQNRKMDLQGFMVWAWLLRPSSYWLPLDCTRTRMLFLFAMAEPSMVCSGAYVVSGPSGLRVGSSCDWVNEAFRVSRTHSSCLYVTWHTYGVRRFSVGVRQGVRQGGARASRMKSPCYRGNGQETWKNWTMAFVCVAGSGHACERDKQEICYLTGKLLILLLRLETVTYAEHWTHGHRTNL